MMAVIIIIVVSITLMGAMALLSGLVLQSIFAWRQNLDALFVAESMADDVLLKLVRDPTTEIDPNDVLNLNEANAYATITHSQQPGEPEMIVVKGVAGSYIRSIRIIYRVDNGKLQVLSRRETR